MSIYPNTFWNRFSVAIGTAFFILFFAAGSLYAVPGELNYDMGSPDTVYIKDTQAIDECNKKLAEEKTQLINCRTTNGLLQKTLHESENKGKKYLWYMIIATILSVSLGILSLGLILRIKKMQRNTLVNSEPQMQGAQ